jgi:toxin ParE1/3/4
MRTVWLGKALDDVVAAAEFIEADNAAAARVLKRRITEAVRLLEDQPSLGRPGRVSGTRELVVPATPYIVAYTVIANQIVVLAVIHGARQWPKSF